ncbi:MAG: amino acid ABC transporter permease [Bifidobacteriaceae bacterium]|nr:amino acid ABC transporter permease [Bifidobacteriaceae bacterium]
MSNSVTQTSESSVEAPSDVELGRRATRRREHIRSITTSIISSLALALVVYTGLKLSPGWTRVKESFFSGQYFASSFMNVLRGLWLNVQVLFFAVIGVAILGLVIALLRTSRSAILFPLRILAMVYTTVLRGIPMIVVLYLIGFGIPGLGIFPGRIDPAILGTIAIILAYSAYVAEVLRAGLESVHPSQRASARSLGLSAGKTMRLVIIPQALRKIAPALMNDFISMQKDVGLISVLGAVDAVRAAQIDVATSYNFTPYVVASVLFILLSIPFIILNDWYSDRLRKRELSGGTV